MNKIICLIAFTAFVAVSSAQGPHYEITGYIDGAEGVTFILQKNSAGKIIYMDTATVANGMFKITGGSVEYPEMVFLLTSDGKKGISFYLENSVITIRASLGSLSTADIKGSKTQDEFQAFTTSLKALGDKYSALNREYSDARQTGDSLRMGELSKELNKIMTDGKAIQKDFVKNNPSSFVVPYILRGIAADMGSSEIESVINAMDPAVSGTPAIIALRKRVEVLKTVDIGKKAPAFSQSDPQGNQVSLSSKIGAKLLLIDFWAAWCAPCRAENPNVVKVYNEFKSKGFDILGVSLDRSGADWNKAISDDKLTWTQVSDLQYWNNAAAKLYGVNSIPANFLLDKDGIIVAKNIRGEELYKKVKELIEGK